MLRRFDDTHDRFLRVSFAEENQSKHLEGQKIAEEITERIRTVLRDGLRLGDRHYRFLAFSSSQLRDHACWFYGESENSEWTCAKIRAWMGEFDVGKRRNVVLR